MAAGIEAMGDRDGDHGAFEYAGGDVGEFGEVFGQPIRVVMTRLGGIAADLGHRVSPWPMSSRRRRM
ncbi:MAG TPA: hypothetical protein VFX70_13445 [Mycobacteriales bacterium]|nr:hypothetical protein [Mycobacteriales bacterium]